jgi:hypothetical protein
MRQTSLLECLGIVTSFPSIMLEMLVNSDSRKRFRTARSAWGLNTAVDAACWRGIRSWLGDLKHVIPLGRQFAKVGHTEEQDSVDDLVKRGGGRTVSGSVLSSSPGGPVEVVLLGFVEDTVDTIHADSGNSCFGVDDVEPWSNGLDKIAHVGSDWVVGTVKNVDEDRPSVELLDGRLWRGWESHVRGCESLGICEGQRST